MNTNERRNFELINAKACVNAVTVFNLQENIKGDSRIDKEAHQRFILFNTAFQKLTGEEKNYFTILRIDALGPIKEQKIWSDEDNVEFLR